MFLVKKLITLLLSSTDDKKGQSIDLIETYAYRTSKDQVNENVATKCNNATSLDHPCGIKYKYDNCFSFFNTQR